MSFRDYSITPASNTTLGDGTYVGPNMLRNKVRPAFQQIMADGKELAEDIAEVLAGPSDAAFIQNGAGAVERTVLSKLRDVVSVADFGAVADDPGTGAFGTDNYPAFAAAIAYLQIVAIAGYINGTIYRGAPALWIPSGGYYLSQSLAPLFTGKILGAGGKGWGAATRLRFPAGVDGLQLQAHNTSGKTTLDVVTHFAGDRLHVCDIAFVGAYTGIESDTHGIRGKRAGTIERCTFDGFEGDGLYTNTTFGAGAPTEGNVNAMRVIDCDFQNNRRGRYCEGDDANAITFIGCSYINNRQAGIDEESFLGNHEFGPHLDGNARTADNTGTAAKPSSYAFNNGHVFFCIKGQEAYCAANSPPATATDNTGWGYWNDQGVATPASGVPQWAGGMTWRAGGPIIHDGASNSSTIVGCHIEGNGVSQVDQGMLIIGTHADVVMVSGGVLVRDRARTMRAGSEGMVLGGPVAVRGPFSAGSVANTIGPYRGATVIDGITSFATRSTAHTIEFKPYDSAGNPGATWLSIPTGSGFGRSNDFLAGLFDRWKFNGVEIAKIDATGVRIYAPGAAVGYSTGAGGAVTQATSKATGVTLNTPTGQITLNNAALAAGAKVSFVVTNSAVAATDTVIPSVASGGTANAYRAAVTAVAAGSFTITVENITAGSLSEAPIINFAVVKAVAA